MSFPLLHDESAAHDAAFALTADPRIHFESRAFRDALRSIVAAVLAGKGIVVVEAATGLGKTHTLRRLTAGGHLVFRAGFVRGRDQDLAGLREEVARALGLEAANQGRHRAGRHGAQGFDTSLLASSKEGSTAVLALDDAQQLSDGVLARLPELSPRRPSNGGFLLQLVLAAPAGFMDRLERPALRPLKERVAEVVPLDALAPEEVGPFVAQRLAAAGPGDALAAATVEAIAKAADGNPRVATWLAGGLAGSPGEAGGVAKVAELVRERSPEELAAHLEVAARRETDEIDDGSLEEAGRKLTRQAAGRAERGSQEAARLARLLGAPRLAAPLFREAEEIAARARARAADEDWEAATVAWVMGRNQYGEATARALRRGALPAVGLALTLVALAALLPPQLRVPALLVGLLAALLFGMPFADRRRDRTRSDGS